MAQPTSPPPSSQQPQQPQKSSPTTSHARKPSTSHYNTVPIDSPFRTTPIHPSLPGIKLPLDASTSNLNPLTLQPFRDVELKSLGYEKLRSEFTSATDGNGPAIVHEQLERAREEAVRLLKEKVTHREELVREVDKQIEDAEKVRAIEVRVYRKKMGDKKGE